jgi:type IV secretory pathway TrbD component
MADRDVVIATGLIALAVAVAIVFFAFMLR